MWPFGTSSSRHRHSSSRSHRGHSPARSIFSSYSSSSRRHGGTSSYYRRSPRDGYVQHLIRKFKYLLQDLWRYARRHPYKVFFMVIMPLVSGGVLHKLARQFGVRLPEMGAGHGGGGAHSYGSGGGYYGSEGYGREGMGGGGGGGGNMNAIGSLASGIGGLASVAKMAQAFMDLGKTVGNLVSEDDRTIYEAAS